MVNANARYTSYFILPHIVPLPLEFIMSDQTSTTYNNTTGGPVETLEELQRYLQLRDVFQDRLAQVRGTLNPFFLLLSMSVFDVLWYVLQGLMELEYLRCEMGHDRVKPEDIPCLDDTNCTQRAPLCTHVDIEAEGTPADNGNLRIVQPHTEIKHWEETVLQQLDAPHAHTEQLRKIRRRFQEGKCTRNATEYFLLERLLG